MCELNIVVKENELLRAQLDVFEKHFKRWERDLQHLLKINYKLEKENDKLKSELRECNSKKTIDVGAIGIGKKTNKKSSDDTKLQEVKQLDFMLEKQLTILFSTVETLEKKLKNSEEKICKYELELKIITQKYELAKTYESDLRAIKEIKRKELKKDFTNIESKIIEMNHFRKVLHDKIKDLCQSLMTNEKQEDDESRQIFDAAASHTFQALVNLEDAYRRNALEEISLQIQVYKYEATRIHQLLTIKAQEYPALFEEQLAHYIHE